MEEMLSGDELNLASTHLNICVILSALSRYKHLLIIVN